MNVWETLQEIQKPSTKTRVIKSWKGQHCMSYFLFTKKENKQEKLILRVLLFSPKSVTAIKVWFLVYGSPLLFHSFIFLPYKQCDSSYVHFTAPRNTVYVQHLSVCHFSKAVYLVDRLHILRCVLRDCLWISKSAFYIICFVLA